MSAAPAEKPLRVLMLSNMYPSAEEPGYGSFIQRQERELTDRFGVQIKLIATPRRGEGMANFTKYAWLLWQTLSATVLGGYDIVHAHYLLPVAAFALIPAGLRRKPLVLTAHGTDIFSGTVWPWRPLISRALRSACGIIVVSEFLAERLAENFGIARVPEREFVIANMGVNTERFTPGDAASLKAAAGIPAGAAHLLFVGNFVEQKGVVDLARALVTLAERGVEFRATMLGHGPEMPEVLRIVEPLGETVQFRTVISHAMLVDVFRSADLFVLPSRREGVGLLVCLEALSCGVPVVAGRAGGLPEIVHDGENGVLVEPGDPEALADTIQGLIEDPARRSALAAAARASALPYSESAQAAKVHRVYEECARN
jgi:glycosyltransferase involved in cell wall biosynthesis